jgi:hypothetical protein
VSLYQVEIHAGARRQALQHDAAQRRLARSLRPYTSRPIDHAPHAVHGAESPLASLRLRLGHALVLVGTAVEGSSAEDAAPSR